MAENIGLMGCMFMVVLCLLSFAASSDAKRYYVGESYGWSIPPNQTFYSDWASSKKFLVGDFLVFNWTGNQDVADVPKADYNNCTASDDDVVIFTGNSNQTVLTIPLLFPGHRYFISTIDNHCEKGQKLHIDVKWPFSSSPSPAPSPS